MGKVKGRTLATLATTVAFVAGAPPAANAYEPGEPSAAGSDASSGAMHCVTVIGKSDSPDKASPILYRHCSDKSEEDARAHFTSREAKARLGEDFRLSAGTNLVRLFEDAYWSYDGDTDVIVGWYGVCDSAGYRIDMSWWWEDRLSSVSRLTPYCNTAKYYNKSQTYSRTRTVPTGNLGDRLNDNVHHFQVYNGN